MVRAKNDLNSEQYEVDEIEKKKNQDWHNAFSAQINFIEIISMASNKKVQHTKLSIL